ncbi:HamA C-terminal domain-containing protein [Paraburkholderia tropica]|uniref:HamA C-terminal domain-containing protein n=1 Tax=Paraburkholderia tropica TaxID=92647 RepID=UPI002ABE2AFA|nr:DUF1837 domain-containing protein [Paraburkholderia tropica]
MEDGSAQPHDIEQYFEPLLGFHSIETRVRKLASADRATPEVNAHFLYPAFQNERPAVAPLVEALTESILGFCVTKAEIAEAKLADVKIRHGSPAIQRLISKAKRRFIKAKESSKSGEGGELLLYALIEHFLQAPIILSKMRLKTSAQMAVHGSDGVHARWDARKNRLVIIFGESKVHASCAAAVKAAAKSVGEFANNIGDRKSYELQLTTDHIDLDGFPEESKGALLRYLHPFATEEANSREDRFAILIAYDSSGYVDPDDVDSAEDEFINYYREDLDRVLRLARQHLKDNKVSLRFVDLFVLPLPNVQDFRDMFKEALRV